MSSNVKKRLEDAFDVGQKIQREYELRDDGNSILQVKKEIYVGDENGIYSIALNQNGTKAAIGLGSGVLHLFDCQTWERIRKIRTSLVTNLPLLAIKFHPCSTSNTLYTGGSDGIIRTWNLDTFSHIKDVSEHGNQITTLDFNSNGRFFATGGKDCSVRVFESDTMNVLRTYNGTNRLNLDSAEDVSVTLGHSKKVFAVKFHPDDSNIVLSASWDRTIKVWDIRTSCAVRTIQGPFVCGDGLDIQHNRLLTGSWKNQNALEMWDYPSGRLISIIPFPTVDRTGEYLYCARFYDDDHVCAGGSGSTDMKFINVNTKKVAGSITGKKHPVQAVEVMEKKKMLVCGTSGNLLKIATILL